MLRKSFQCVFSPTLPKTHGSAAWHKREPSSMGLQLLKLLSLTSDEVGSGFEDL